MKELSYREIQVIEATIDGQTRQQFGADHGIARQTVSVFVMRAKKKLGATTFEQACVIYDRSKRK